MKSLLLCFTASTFALADPAWNADLSPPKPGVHPPLAPCTLDFTLSWKGMVKAGSLTMEFAPRHAKKTGALVVTSTASSQGAAAALFPYSHSYWSEINPSTLAPRYFQSTEEDAEESIVNTNRFTASGVDARETSTDLTTKAVTPAAFHFPLPRSPRHVLRHPLDPQPEARARR